jgi:hypothetical protein
MIQVVLWLTFAAVTSAFVLPPHHAARVAESRPGGMVAWAAPSPFSNLLRKSVGLRVLIGACYVEKQSDVLFILCGVLT